MQAEERCYSVKLKYAKTSLTVIPRKFIPSKLYRMGAYFSPVSALTRRLVVDSQIALVLDL